MLLLAEGTPCTMKRFRFCTETFWPISPLTTDRIQMRSRAADYVPQHPETSGAELLITEIYHQVCQIVSVLKEVFD